MNSIEKTTTGTTASLPNKPGERRAKISEFTSKILDLYQLVDHACPAPDSVPSLFNRNLP